MLEDKRIKEAENNIKRYIEDKMMTKEENLRKDVFETFQRNYIDSINVAQKIYNQNLSSLWVIVTAYYSMYYIANAVLYKNGYKVGSKISHKITADALIVFIRNKLKKAIIDDYEKAQTEALEIIGRKTDDIISHYDKELEKRSTFQYESTEQIKRSKALTSLERANEFIFELKKLL